MPRENSTNMPDYQFHLCLAAGSAATVEEMQSAWSMIDASHSKEALSTIVGQALGRNVLSTPIIEFLGKNGKMSDPDIVEQAFRLAILSGNEAIVEKICSHQDFQTIVKTDPMGNLLMPCMQSIVGAGGGNLLLERLVRIGPPQSALDLALGYVANQAPDAHSSAKWDHAFDILVKHGASPFHNMEIKLEGNVFVCGEPVLFFIAKNASRLVGRGASYLESLLGKHPASDILGYREDDNHKTKTFVSMWCGGQGDLAALVSGLNSYDKQGGNWRDGDPLGVLPEALRLGCLDDQCPLFVALCSGSSQEIREKIPSFRIRETIDQAFRSCMLASTQKTTPIGSILDQLMETRSREDMAEAYAERRDFWSKCAVSLAPLFQDPAAWQKSCAHIQSALQRQTKASNEEIDACLHAIDLDCATDPSPPTRASLRL